MPASLAVTAEPSTVSTASTKAASSSTSSTESKTPAIDDAAPSSPVDDDRTTTARVPSSETDRHTASAVARSSCDQLVVSTAPPRAGRPARRALARFAAFDPVRRGSPASGSSSDRAFVLPSIVRPSPSALSWRCRGCDMAGT
jgi:hypothetical protein